METEDISPLVDDLSNNIDSLEKALKPLFESPLEEFSSKLPLLDKAKLHVHLAYTLHSLLFSALRLNGVDAKEHPVFTELTRIKQYFEKIKAAEEGPAQSKNKLSLDKDAAGRLIKHALTSQQGQETEPMHIRFNDAGLEDKAVSASQKDGAQDAETELTGNNASENNESAMEADEELERKRKRTETARTLQMNEDTELEKEGNASAADPKRLKYEKHEQHAKQQRYHHHGKGKSSEAPKSSSTVIQHLLKKSKSKSDVGFEKG